MADTHELQVNGATTSSRESDAYKKHGRHFKTASEQMMEAHAVEQALLEEIWFGKFIVKCPFLLCFIIMTILFIVMFIDAQIFVLSEQSNRTFLVEGDRFVNAYDAYTLAGQFIADNAVDNSSVLPQTEKIDFWIYQHMFTLKDYHNDFDINNPENTDYWILTPQNIETIIKYENMIVEDEEWRNQFCYAGPDPISTNYSCQPAIISAARMIYNDANFSSMTTDDIKEWVDDRLKSMKLDSFFNPGVAETGQAFIYRSFFYAGVPIATEWETTNGTTIHETTYRNPLDDTSSQEQEYIDWATTLFKEVTVDHNGDLIDGDLKILTVSWVVYNAYFNVLLNESMIYLIFAVAIVLVYMSIHLSSIFLAVCALFQILMSFPLAYFFYRIIFQIPHYDTLSSLIIFVLLGVGADDVFVFTDAWLQSSHFVKDSGLSSIKEKSKCCKVCIDDDEQKNILKMSFAFRRAAKAMLVTQMTTFFAFLATATSAVMPIAAFGIWAATIVAMNYVLVITMYPAVLIIHHRFLKKYESSCLCCLCNLCCNKKEKVRAPKASPHTPNDENMVGDDGNMMPEISRQLSLEEQAEEYRCFEQFLGRKWSKYIIKFKYFTLIFFTILLGVAAYFGSQMEAQSEDEKWFADEHFMQKAQDEATQFSASETDNLVQILITFGIDGVDRSGTVRWDPEDYGQVVWDSTFNMKSPEAQSYLLTICSKTKNSSLVYGSHLVTCPIEDFKDYVESIGETFPYQSTANKASFGSVYNDYLSSSYGLDARSNALTYVVEGAEEYEVRFYAMYIYTTLTWNDASDVSRDERAKWDDFIEEFSILCPDGLCNSVENVALRWCWLVTQQKFVQSAIQGILIAMPLAFMILLISTHNWIISIFAVIDIIGIMLCELSIMYLQGWKFGVSECVAIVIIIGFSVDYVVHLANAYLESIANDREGRLSFALLTMGISVVSGAVTTFAAGFFLVFPDIVFFYKMGILMISTVAISIFWAMCFFTSIVAVWGPQENAGDLTKYFKCCPCCKNKSKISIASESGKGERRETYQDYQIDNDEFKGYALEIDENMNKEGGIR